MTAFLLPEISICFAELMNRSLRSLLSSWLVFSRSKRAFNIIKKKKTRNSEVDDVANSESEDNTSSKRGFNYAQNNLGTNNSK